MTEPAISIVNLGKKYHIGQQRSSSSYRTLRDTITESLTAPFRRARKLLSGQATGAAELDETIWALRDVSFEVQRGEVVGLIGHNGAGKSTLLKVLSRITEPTEGHVDLRGRVGSLLEVGTGFHQELTGRENIYLNGAILGMARTEIERKFDEIVAFAEIERFIDTPVKHYSSGMRLRLGFAVAAHLEPEILVVDEVLAVGDAQFQRKCLQKMEDVGDEGRTVVFVSHNMQAITRLCERTILLTNGELVADGPAHQVVAEYLSTGGGTMARREWSNPALAPAGDATRLCAVRVRTEDGRVSDSLDIRIPIILEMEYDVVEPGYVLMPHFHLINQEGVRLFVTIDQDPEWRGQERPVGHYKSSARIPGNYLAEGMHYVDANMRSLRPHGAEFSAQDAVAFQVVDSLDGDSARADWGGKMPGVVRPLLEWSTEYTPNGRTVSEEAVTVTHVQ